MPYGALQKAWFLFAQLIVSKHFNSGLIFGRRANVIKDTKLSGALMFKADDYRLKLKTLSDSLAEAKYALDIDVLGSRLDELKAEQEKPEVWQDLEKSTKIGREISSVENKIASYNNGASARRGY